MMWISGDKNLLAVLAGQRSTSTLPDPADRLKLHKKNTKKRN